MCKCLRKTDQRGACGTIISTLHFCSEAIRIYYPWRYRTEYKLWFSFFFPQTSKHHPFKDGSPEKDTQQSDRNNGTNNNMKWCVSPRGVSSGWVCTDRTLITLLGKVSNQKQCWHDMKFILWQDGKKPEKVSFETEHCISTKSGTFFFLSLYSEYQWN